jgi:hypothetical protein
MQPWKHNWSFLHLLPQFDIAPTQEIFVPQAPDSEGHFSAMHFRFSSIMDYRVSFSCISKLKVKETSSATARTIFFIMFDNNYYIKKTNK